MKAISQVLEPSDTLESRRVWTVGFVGVVGYSATLIGLGTVWYADYPSQDFHFFDDNDQWLQMDKAGHSIAAYQLSRYGFEASRWAGIPEKSGGWLGPGSALLFLTGMEVLDGFSSGWGFSGGDMVANLGGSVLFFGQQKWWNEQRIALKFSYSPTEFAKYRPELLGRSLNERVLKDYNGQTAWLSINPSAFTKKPHPIWPWLNVAIGYGADGMLGGSSNPSFDGAGEALPSISRRRQYYLSLDVDLSRIRTESHVLKTIFSIVGFVKIPAPTLELSGSQFEWHWFYF